MQDTPNFDPVLPTDHLAGETPPDGQPIPEQWHTVDGANPPVVQWGRMWSAIRERERIPVDVAAIDRGVQAYVAASRARELGDTGTHKASIQASRYSPRNPTRWSGIFAAACTIAAAVGLATYFDVFSKSEPAEQGSTYATARGHQQTVTLADGTRIVLAPETKIRVNVPASGPRVVDLDGEAVFTVDHAAERPFVVRTQGTSVRVLGTTFGVRRYSNDPVTRVAVREGKVAMNTIALVAGDVGESANDGTTRVVREQDVRAALSWMNGTLVFKDTPLSEIASQLSRWYDIDVVLADPSLSSLPFTLSVRNERIDEVLASIARAANVRVTQQGRVVTISSIH